MENYLLSDKLNDYVNEHTQKEQDYLAELNRETHLKTMVPAMLSGNYQGQVLKMICQMINPSRVLEIGTFTGYATIYLAQGLADNGQIHTIEINNELEEISQKYFERSGLKEKIIPYFGDALEVIPTINETFDLVFIDADKNNYHNYFDLVIEKLRPGGIILSDNVLWSGKVLEDNPDKMTRFIQAYNDKVHADPRVENLLLPIRDGIMIARKIG